MTIPIPLRFQFDCCWATTCPLLIDISFASSSILFRPYARRMIIAAIGYWLLTARTEATLQHRFSASPAGLDSNKKKGRKNREEKKKSFIYNSMTAHNWPFFLSLFFFRGTCSHERITPLALARYRLLVPIATCTCRPSLSLSSYFLFFFSRGI